MTRRIIIFRRNCRPAIDCHRITINIAPCIASPASHLLAIKHGRRAIIISALYHQLDARAIRPII